jgi:hypothetical protein
MDWMVFKVERKWLFDNGKHSNARQICVHYLNGLMNAWSKHPKGGSTLKYLSYNLAIIQYGTVFGH